MRAFTSYRGGDYDEAINAAKRYLSLYPGTPEAAYAQYIIGLSYYRQIPDVTRDQGGAARAAAAMREVIERYPDSAYVEDAKTKLRIARDQLAGKEMQVGRYYLERRDYVAAINRFKNVVDVYPESRQVEEALARLTEAYYAMGLTGEAQAAASVLGQNFPDSPWYRRLLHAPEVQGPGAARGRGDVVVRRRRPEDRRRLIRRLITAEDPAGREAARPDARAADRPPRTDFPVLFSFGDASADRSVYIGRQCCHSGDASLPTIRPCWFIYRSVTSSSSSASTCRSAKGFPC